MPVEIVTADLKQAMQNRGCPVCNVQRNQANDYIQLFIWERVTDGGVRDRLLKSLGFCPQHTQLLVETERKMLGSATAVNLVYEHMARAAMTRLERWQPPPVESPWRALLKRLRRFLHREQPSPRHRLRYSACPLCELNRQATAFALDALFSELDNGKESMLTAYASSDGICLDHLQAGLDELGEQFPRGAKHLIQDMLQRLQIRQELMTEYIRKKGWEYQNERVSPEEARAWREALVFFTGEYPTI